VVRHLASASLSKEIPNANTDSKASLEKSCTNVERLEYSGKTVILSFKVKRFFVRNTTVNITDTPIPNVEYVAQHTQSVVVNACWFNLADKVVGYRLVN